MSNKRTDCSNLTAAMQKNGGKNVASVTNYDILYMETAGIKRAVNLFLLRVQILK